MFCWLTIFT
jgi:U2 small nuclear ribonucleoprotein B''